MIPKQSKEVRTTRRIREPRQFQTHRQLLANTSKRVPALLDAIVVPASRPAVNLDHAVSLARKLGCHLVVLCSLKARADEVNDLLALRNFNQAVVVDLPEGYLIPKLDLQTSKRTSLGLPDSCVSPNGDLSTKRNIGLLLARMMGWERIFFLDDDIRDLYSSDLREVARMLGPHDAVGMRAVDFPDNSVVCHAHRETGEYQDIFVSGSALAVHCTDTVAFFPEIYNEDWFFFYRAVAKRRLGLFGRDATQLCYDPFANPQRAAGQEFGDIMAEGLYSLLHGQLGADHATAEYWRTFLDSRISFLKGVLGQAETVEPYLRARIVSSITAAMEWSQQIQPSMCEDYLTLWKQDLVAWERRLKQAPTVLSAKQALREIDLTPSAQSPYWLAGIIGKNADGTTRHCISSEAADRPSRVLGATERTKPTGTRDLPQEKLTTIDAVGRVSRWAIDVLSYAIVAQERSVPVVATRIATSGRLQSGRHRENPSSPWLRHLLRLKRQQLMLTMRAAARRQLSAAGSPAQPVGGPGSPPVDSAWPTDPAATRTDLILEPT
jgi:hypothetical protein